MILRVLTFTIAVAGAVVSPWLSHGQTSELYAIYSPNVIYPYGTTYVFQGGHPVRSWAQVNSYEVAPGAVGGTVRQSALYNAGSEYTPAGVPTGTHYPTIADTYDAASDGSSIYGWNLVTATLTQYDLNWKYQRSLFSLGSTYSYTYMGITFDLQNNSIWLSPWSTGARDVSGHLYNYSLDGRLLGTLNLANPRANGNGLAYDPADSTLWFFNWTDNRYEQYAKHGGLLSTMTGMSRIYGAEFMMVPEPTVGALGLAGLVLIGMRRRMKHSVASPDQS